MAVQLSSDAGNAPRARPSRYSMPAQLSSDAGNAAPQPAEANSAALRNLRNPARTLRNPAPHHDHEKISYDVKKSSL